MPKNSANPALNSFQKMKEEARKITMITAYDYSMARCVAASQMDIILVGDSLGMTVLGYDTTLKVTLQDMVVHTAAVRRGAPETFVIADLPYLSYHLDLNQTKANAAELIVAGGANAVKLEGGSPSRVEAVKAIIDCEIPVCGHLGLTPQSVVKFGGFKVQGKTPAAHEQLIKEALELERAGIFMLVLEGIPEALGRDITAAVKIPTIGIGAGRHTDGQVLVYHDVLGHSIFLPKFAKTYARLDGTIVSALDAYCAEVRDGSYPAPEHIYYPLP